MNRNQVEYVMDYAERQGCDVQITYENGIFTAFFKNEIHGKVCSEEMLFSGNYVSSDITWHNKAKV